MTRLCSNSTETLEVLPPGHPSFYFPDPSFPYKSSRLVLGVSGLCARCPSQRCQLCVSAWSAVCRQVINNCQDFFSSSACPESYTFFSHLRNHGKRIFPLRTQRIRKVPSTHAHAQTRRWSNLLIQPCYKPNIIKFMRRRRLFKSEILTCCITSTVGMRGAFLLSCKYGKLAEITQRDKSLGGQKIEGTRKQSHWCRGEGVGPGGSFGR